MQPLTCGDRTPPDLAAELDRRRAATLRLPPLEDRGVVRDPWLHPRPRPARDRAASLAAAHHLLALLDRDGLMLQALGVTRGDLAAAA